MKPAILFIEFIQCQLHPYNCVVVVEVMVMDVETITCEVDWYKFIKFCPLLRLQI